MNTRTSRIARITGSVALAAGLAVGMASGAQAASSYTAKDVAKHNTAANCWSIVGSNVYNLTKWVPKHPGGAATVAAMCGKNGTKMFTAKHGSSATAKATLSKYKIGTLKK